MKKVITVLTVLAIGALASQASAAPFALVKMTDLDGNAVVQTTVGSTVDFKITVELNAIGTVNTTSVGGRTITARVTGTDGIGAARFNVQQSLADLVQVSFDSAVTLYSGYAAGLGASGGTLMTRGNGYDNLNSIWAVKNIGDPAAGANAPVLVATGSFTVMEGLAGDSSTIKLTYISPTLSPGTIRYNNNVGVLAKSTDVDPYFGFTGLTVEIIPEPATLAVLGLGGMLLAIRRRR